MLFVKSFSLAQPFHVCPSHYFLGLTFVFLSIEIKVWPGFSPVSTAACINTAG